MTFAQLWEFVQATGVLGGTFILGWALWTKKLRFGWAYDELQIAHDRIAAKNEKLEAEREALLMTALSNAGIANVLLQSAEARKAATG